MRRSTWLIAAMVLPVLLEAPCRLHAQEHAPLPSVSAGGGGEYASGVYRNLLREAGHSDAQIEQRIRDTFQQLFHGDAKSQAVYYSAGSNANGPLAYVTDIANHDARTEGISYGMMIAVQTNHKVEFDALWNWANTFMLITDPNNPSVGYFAWSMGTDGTPKSDSPAPDGEEYFAMSLYFAAHRWGNGKGIYNYQAQADRILHEMRHHAVRTGSGPFRIHPDDPAFEPETSHSVHRKATVGPMVNETWRQICFVPSEGANQFTDPSYHLPAFYELWARWGPKEDREFWASAASASRAFFVKTVDPITGLSPDYANFDGTPKPTSFNPMSADYSYDSWRTASNWAVDQAWWGKDQQARVLSDRLQNFLSAQGVKTFSDQYILDGKPLSTRHSTGMVASVATTGLAATVGPVERAFVDQLWATPVPSGEQRYFDGMLYMMSLLHAGGQFRIWMPGDALRTSATARRR